MEGKVRKNKKTLVCRPPPQHRISPPPIACAFTLFWIATPKSTEQNDAVLIALSLAHEAQTTYACMSSFHHALKLSRPVFIYLARMSLHVVHVARTHNVEAMLLNSREL